MSNLKKTAIILCGGQGSRLGNLGKKFPKNSCKDPRPANTLVYYKYFKKKFI